MAEHNLSYTETYREDNDTPDEVTYDTELARIIREAWKPENALGLRPVVYGVSNMLTNDMGTSPYIIVYPPEESDEFVGVNAPAFRTDMTMRLEIRVLHKAHQMPVKNEVRRILYAHRKKPFLNVDQLLSLSGRPVEPTPGNFFYSFDAKYKIYITAVVDE